MKRFTLMVALLIVFITLPAFAQDTRMFTIRDDDGTADEGRAQMGSPYYIARKTLILDRDPAEITNAWVQYYMKVNPYDKVTQKLYDHPVEGVEFTDLVVTLNGTEIVRGTLPKYASEGWHRVQIKPQLLKRGANHVTITVSEPGDYIYLGIDRDNDYGRSASSRNKGKSWRPGQPSMKTEKPQGGEYMVRLQYQAPLAPETGFIERDSQHYGWLELEDLFSTETLHSSGFKAIEWEKGENAPSRDLLAWGLDGRFNFSVTLPVDTDWTLWLRAWADDFRGGEFTLSIDGDTVYDSADHDASSDTAIELEWLKMEELHLGEGEHVVEFQTEGECGHMFDVLVFTTDSGFLPDVSDPLPRMTTVSSLVEGPERDITELEPGLFMTDNPIRWAKPLAEGPLKTLWICGDINEREIVELQQRIDMEAQSISTPVRYKGGGLFGNLSLSMDDGDLIYETLIGDDPPDVVIFVRAGLAQLPGYALEALVERVENGGGLIVVRPTRETELPTEIGDLLEKRKPLDVSHVAAPFEFSALDEPQVREYGQGRMIVLPYMQWGTVGRVSNSHELRYPYWEYQFGRWVQLLMTAAGRDTAAVQAVEVPDNVEPGQQLTATVRVEGQAENVRAAWLKPFADKPVSLDPVPVREGSATITLPAASERGQYHLVCTCTDADGDAVGVGSAQYEISHPTQIMNLVATCSDDGSQAEARLDVYGEDNDLTVVAEVYGSHGRLLGRAAKTLEPGHHRTITVPLIPSFERLVEMRLRVPGQGGPQQRLRQLFTRPQEVVVDDFAPHCGVYTARECPDYCKSVYMRIYDRIGAKATHPLGAVWDSLEQGFSTARPARLTKAGNPKVTPDGERVPCLHDPELWEKEEPSIRERARNFNKFSPLMLGLGDEMSLGRKEACFSEHTKAAFRQWLQKQYDSLEALNSAWETDFVAWDDVEPWRLEDARERPDNIGLWLQFRNFMVHTFVNAIVKMQTWAQEAAGDTHIGGVNPWDEGWTTCTVMSKLFPVLEYGQIYPRSLDLARSWFREPRLIGTWSGYNRPRKQIEREAWQLPAYGGTLMCWYGLGREGGYGTLTGTLDLGDRARWISQIHHELNSGIGRLLIDAEVAQEPVAILDSFPGRCAYIAITGAKATEKPGDALDENWDRTLASFARLLRQLRVPYRYVSPEQIENGVLAEKGYEALIAPWAWSVSDETLAKIEDFANDHPVVCDSQMGAWDAVGRKRGQAPVNAWGGNDNLTVWDELPAPWNDESRQRLREVIEASGITPGDEAIHGDINFIVEKRLGDLQMLVAFGEGELTVDLPRRMHAYDAREHQSLGEVSQAAAQMEHGPAVLVFSEEPLTGLALSATGAKRGETVNYEVSLASGHDTVARVDVIGPNGEEYPWLGDNVSVHSGKGSGSYTPALNDPSGEWMLKATDIISGETAAATVHIKP